MQPAALKSRASHSAPTCDSARSHSVASTALPLSSKNQVRRLRGLLNAGVPPSSCDYDRRTALHVACAGGHLEAATLLADAGADLHARDRFGCTPLDDAMQCGPEAGNHELIAFLKSRKATHGAVGKMQARMLDACAKGDVGALKQLLAKDASGAPVPGSAALTPNFFGHDKRTPLHLAVAEGHEAAVRLLLANGADPRAVDRWGFTPIDEAERKSARVGSDPILTMFHKGGWIKEKESIWSFFSIFFGPCSTARSEARPLQHCLSSLLTYLTCES